MKNIFLPLFLLAISIFHVDVFAQNLNWQWAKSSIGSGNETGNDLSTDAFGNIFITGDFSSSSVAFGTSTIANTSGSSDFYVAKYNSSGNVIWVKSAVGTSTDTGNGVCNDAVGNVIVIGNFYSPSLSFGTVTLNNSSNNLTSNVFIAKYDPSGNLLWATSIGGAGNESGYNISTDTLGNIYITGYFTSPAIAFGSFSLLNLGNNNLFVAKLDPSGNVIWAKGGTVNSQGSDVKVDASGNVYLTGSFAGAPFTFGSTSLTSSGGSDMFLVKFNSAGNAVWAKSANGTNQDFGNDIAINPAGEIYITGMTNSASMNFGAVTLTGMGNITDSFIVKYDTSGTAQWANSIGGINNTAQLITGISLDLAGNPNVSGWFNGSFISFGTSTLSNPGGLQPIFITKYDPAGNFLLANIISGNNIDAPTNISIDSNDNVYVAGSFQSNSLTFGFTTINNSGNSDVFLAKFNGSTPVSLNKFDNSAFESVLIPNPFSAQTVFQINYKLSNATLSIRNGLGQTIREIKNISGQTITIYRENLPKGIYYFSLYQDQKIIRSGKLIITND